jgi:hypothetical protein
MPGPSTQTAENLILHGQALEGPGLPGRIEALKARRRELREGLFRMFNPHFGSVFRTYTHRTAFFNDLCRYGFFPFLHPITQ